jgi:hypothetical protein
MTKSKKEGEEKLPHLNWKPCSDSWRRRGEGEGDCHRLGSGGAPCSGSACTLRGEESRREVQVGGELGVAFIG